jgi:hypothetical protein
MAGSASFCNTLPLQRLPIQPFCVDIVSRPHYHRANLRLVSNSSLLLSAMMEKKDIPMNAYRPHLSSTVPVLACLATPDRFLLRPQLPTRI